MKTLFLTLLLLSSQVFAQRATDWVACVKSYEKTKSSLLSVPRQDDHIIYRTSVFSGKKSSLNITHKGEFWQLDIQALDDANHASKSGEYFIQRGKVKEMLIDLGGDKFCLNLKMAWIFSDEIRQLTPAVNGKCPGNPDLKSLKFVKSTNNNRDSSESALLQKIKGDLDLTLSAFDGKSDADKHLQSESYAQLAEWKDTKACEKVADPEFKKMIARKNQILSLPDPGKASTDSGKPSGTGNR